MNLELSPNLGYRPGDGARAHTTGNKHREDHGQSPFLPPQALSLCLDRFRSGEGDAGVHQVSEDLLSDIADGRVSNRHEGFKAGTVSANNTRRTGVRWTH